VVNTPLIKSKEVYVPPLHFKIGRMKNFVKAMDQNITPLMYLKNQFPTMCDAKIKEGLFDGPQIRELKQDVKFEGQLNEVEKVEWKLYHCGKP
jgi:hypothetical protein